ncbi:MAG: peptide deformylase [Bdellovibrionales bacterium]
MAVRNILRMGHPVLRQKARELKKKEILSPAIQTLIKDMIETMHDADGVGIAAPQVGESLQLSVIEFGDDNPRYQDFGAQGLTVFINPVLTVVDKKEQSFWEGCLSVPDLRGLVHRPRKVKVTYLDEKGEKQELEAEGFLATVLQHEFDHLDGVLYIDRIQDPRDLSYIEEYKEFIMDQTEHDELDD